MKHNYLFLLIPVIAAFPAQAQPTLNTIDVAQTDGATFIIQYAAYQSPGAPGADQTWDLSSALSTETHSATYVLPSSTPNSADFPGATWAQEYDAPSGFDTYLQFTATGIYSLGSDLGGLQHIVYSDTRQDFPLPLTYNGTWTDSFFGNLTSPFGTGTLSGTVTGTADGFGTLILPYGTFTNVLRVHTVTTTEQNIITPSPSTSTVTDDGYSFFKPGVPVGLAGTSQSTNVGTGGTTTSSGLTYLDESSIGMAEAHQQEVGISLAPNPATDNLSMVFGVGGHVALSVFDALGRQVMATDLGTLAPAIHSRTLDVSALPAGHYLLRLVTEDGQTGMRSFVVDRG